MIEKYFMPGRRFKWKLPAEAPTAADGRIIDSPLNIVYAPMVYMGMDGRLYKPTTANLIAQSRAPLTMYGQVQYSWLAYAPGRTTRLSVVGDILTGPMSGCIIPIWRDKGHRYVGHVGTVGDRVRDNRVKAIFGASMPGTTIGFNPGSGVWDTDAANILAKISELKTGKISEFTGKELMKRAKGTWKQFALVTTEDKCYSIMMVPLEPVCNNIWVVGGIKKVEVMDYYDLREKFLPRGRYMEGGVGLIT
ncbi:MAG: hypothetical protein RPU37_07120 [Candidatus Sedimenticola sp. (ex Thyasira tokunagai)]